MATDLGARIKRARLLLELTQAQLGARVGASARAVGSWERGEKVPRNLPVLEVALAPYFSTGEQSPKPIRQLDFDPGDQDEVRIVGWTDLTVARRQAMIDELRAARHAARNTA